MNLKKSKIKDNVRSEVTLQELAYQFGYEHLAAKQYTQLAHAIRMLDQCYWWKCFGNAVSGKF